MKTIAVKGTVAEGKLFVRYYSDDTLHVFTDPEVKGRESIIFNDRRTTVSLKLRRMKETRVYSTAKLHWVEVPKEKQRWEYRVDSYHFGNLPGANIRSAEKLMKELIPQVTPLFEDDELLYNDRLERATKLLESEKRDVKNETFALARSKRCVKMLETALKKNTSVALGKALDDHRQRNY